MKTLYGTGCEVNYSKSLKFFKFSAKKGYPPGIRMLGYFYQNGLGCRINEKEAFKLYTLAADKNEMVAEYDVG